MATRNSTVQSSSTKSYTKAELETVGAKFASVSGDGKTQTPAKRLSDAQVDALDDVCEIVDSARTVVSDGIALWAANSTGAAAVLQLIECTLDRAHGIVDRALRYESESDRPDAAQFEYATVCLASIGAAIERCLADADVDESGFAHLCAVKVMCRSAANALDNLPDDTVEASA